MNTVLKFRNDDKVFILDDLKNIGGKFGGAITAGKFLEHFISYPWLHFGIAGTAFLDKAEYYRPAGATGIHVRLLMKFSER